jgi:hypothetical protein
VSTHRITGADVGELPRQRHEPDDLGPRGGDLLEAEQPLRRFPGPLPPGPRGPLEGVGRHSEEPFPRSDLSEHEKQVGAGLRILLRLPRLAERCDVGGPVDERLPLRGETSCRRRVRRRADGATIQRERAPHLPRGGVGARHQREELGDVRVDELLVEQVPRHLPRLVVPLHPAVDPQLQVDRRQREVPGAGKQDRPVRRLQRLVEIPPGQQELADPHPHEPLPLVVGGRVRKVQEPPQRLLRPARGEFALRLQERNDRYGARGGPRTGPQDGDGVPAGDEGHGRFHGRRKERKKKQG